MLASSGSQRVTRSRSDSRIDQRHRGGNADRLAHRRERNTVSRCIGSRVSMSRWPISLTCNTSERWHTTTTAANGTHTLTARAYDAAGNTTDSAVVSHRQQRRRHHGTHGEPHRTRRGRHRVGHCEPHRHRLRQCRGGQGAVLLGKALGRRR